jgi:hypothetical protein
MTDIVERLRTQEVDLFRLQDEAADTIESLRAQVRALDSLTAFQQRTCEQMLEQLAACEKERDTAIAALDAKIDICGDQIITDLREQLDAALGEEVVLAALQQRYVRPSAAARPRTCRQRRARTSRAAWPGRSASSRECACVR